MIIDDHAIARMGLRNLVTTVAGCEVCAEADCAEAALATFPEPSPDMCIIDVALPGMSGMELTRALVRRYPGCHVLIVSAYHADLVARLAREAGAKGYVGKNEPTEILQRAIACVASGEVFSVNVAGSRPSADDPAIVLSVRELEIFYMIGSGLSVAEIAAKLHRSEKTIDVHRQAIKQKLNLATTAKLGAYAAQWKQAQETHPKPAMPSGEG